MKKKLLNGEIQLPIIVGLLILGLIISLTVNLAQKNQKMETKAAGDNLTTPGQNKQD